MYKGDCMKFISNFKKVYKYSHGYKRYIILYFIMSIILSLLGILVPAISAFQLVSLTNSLFDKVILATILIFGINVFIALVSFIEKYGSEKFSKYVISNIQLDLGKEILKINISDIDKHSNGLFIQRLSGDASSITSVFTFGLHIFTSIIRDVGVIVVIFVINFWIGLYFLLFFIVFSILQRYRIKKIDKNDRKYRKQKENTSGFATELIRGIRDIKMLNAEASFLNKMKSNIDELNQKSYDMNYTSRVFWLIEDILRYLFDLILMFLLILFVKQNIFDVALGIVIYNYRRDILSLVYSLNSFLDYIREYNLSCERVFALIDGKEFKKEKFGSIHLDKINGNFEFRNVSFSYEKDKLVLDKINFRVNANETVAFVGKSGVGKSTIFNLLCKMYDVDSGEILIDNININELDKDSIRGNITVINQEPYIFNMSIRDNLKLVKEDLSEEEMIYACKQACIDEFINSLKDGYDTILGENGVNLSGGQKQRLAIARALVQKTEIILFDEATSALDNETQSKIKSAIDNMKNEYTILIIAHRLSTIINCDKIFFIDDGKIIDSGTHKELMKKNKDYKKLYESEIINKE